MVERKLFKTKLCALYRRGRCHRQTCSFAHGEAELRRFPGSFSDVIPNDGRRDFRGNDLRDKLGRRRSPPRRYSLDKDARHRHTSPGHSPPRSIEKRRGRNQRKKDQFDDRNDLSESMQSDGTEDELKDQKTTSSDSRDLLNEQLRHVLAEVEALGEEKHQLEVYLEERDQEADSLTSKIQELELQLSKEKEECKRITSKITKFVKAHNHNLRIQDELKRSQARLQKLVEQLGSEITYAGGNDEDVNINVFSDEETFGDYQVVNEQEKHSYPSKKRPRVHIREADEDSKQGGRSTIRSRSEKHSRWDEHQLNSSKDIEAEGNGNRGLRALVNEDKPRRAKSNLANASSMDKVRDSASGTLLPSTGMAAHAADEVVEVVEMNEKFHAGVSLTRVVTGAEDENSVLAFPPPPPPLTILQNAYVQNEGKHNNVDAEGVDEEMVHVDIV